MDSDDRLYAIGITVVSLAIASVIGALIVWGILAHNNEHDFDRTCITSGRSLTYITLQGSDYSKKVCLVK